MRNTFVTQKYKDEAILEYIDKAECMISLLQGYIDSLNNKEDLITISQALLILEGCITEIYRSACHYKLDTEVNHG